MINKEWKLKDADLNGRLREILGPTARVEQFDYATEEDIESGAAARLGLAPNYKIVYTKLETPKTSTTVGQWRQYGLPGCCGIQVYSCFHEFTLPEELQRKGIATLQNLIAIHIARSEGYSRLIATDVTEPRGPAYRHSVKVFEKAGWTKISEFVNKRTANRVGMFEKDLLAP